MYISGEIVFCPIEKFYELFNEQRPSTSTTTVTIRFVTSGSQDLKTFYTYRSFIETKKPILKFKMAGKIKIRLQKKINTN